LDGVLSNRRLRAKGCDQRDRPGQRRFQHLSTGRY
jgi:hypothetical protein